IERGARNASLQTIEKLAKALRISLSTMFEPLGQSLEKEADTINLPSKPRVVDILLVEDDGRDVALTVKAFEAARLNNRIHVVRDGADALNYIFCRGEHAKRDFTELPQVILLDLKLPKVHGMEVLRTIKAEPRTRAIRVVVLTISRRDEHIAEALRLGAEAY